MMMTVEEEFFFDAARSFYALKYLSLFYVCIWFKFLWFATFAVNLYSLSEWPARVPVTNSVYPVHTCVIKILMVLKCFHLL